MYAYLYYSRGGIRIHPNASRAKDTDMVPQYDLFLYRQDDQPLDAKAFVKRLADLVPPCALGYTNLPELEVHYHWIQGLLKNFAQSALPNVVYAISVTHHRDELIAAMRDMFKHGLVRFGIGNIVPQHSSWDVSDDESDDEHKQHEQPYSESAQDENVKTLVLESEKEDESGDDDASLPSNFDYSDVNRLHRLAKQARNHKKRQHAQQGAPLPKRIRQCDCGADYVEPDAPCSSWCASKY